MMELTDDELIVLADLGLLDDEAMTLLEAMQVSAPPEEPEPPMIDNPPGDWTEYSDTPPSYRLLRLDRGKYTAEEAHAQMEVLCKSWGVRPYGEGYYCLRWWTWRVR